MKSVPELEQLFHFLSHCLKRRPLTFSAVKTTYNTELVFKFAWGKFNFFLRKGVSRLRLVRAHSMNLPWNNPPLRIILSVNVN